MRIDSRWGVVLLLIANLQLAACKQAEVATSEAGEDDKAPATVEHLEGAEPTRITLIPEAMKRIDIQTASVREAEFGGSLRKVIPYSAVLYDTEGGAWAYTTQESGVFVRHHITIDHIDGNDVILSDGPATGTLVVTVGAAELYGSESEFEEE